ncbi:hypothetical protein N7454_003056 [Penicillium verhagenii]|nr:hypothetical protein N7454_003056 [Penicillium verhagenii]
MGNVGSRLDEAGNLFFKDQNRYSDQICAPQTQTQVQTQTQTNSSTKIQDPDVPSTAPTPTFLLRLANDEELIFNFTFILRQTQTSNATGSTVNGVSTSLPEVSDTVLNGLTFAHASNSKELDNLITREFHANPNLQNNSNVQLIGDFSTEGTPSVSFEWSWTWKPPKGTEDKGGGWRNSCSLLDYDQRTNRLNTLAHFSFWVHNSVRLLPSPRIMSPNLELPVPPRSRVPSTQSTVSHFSDPDITHQGVPSITPPETADGAPAPLLRHSPHPHPL